MRILVTGGSGVLGRATVPVLRGAGHDAAAPGRAELDLLEPAAAAVARAVAGSDAVLHLATRIPPDTLAHPGAWEENDRLRRDASRRLVDAALAAGTAVFVFPSVAFLAEDGVTETLRSALDAERETARFAAEGRRGVVLRLGLLDGPGTPYPEPNPVYGVTLHVEDAGRALAAALALASGTYAVCRDGERVSNRRFRQATGWRPER